MSLPDRLFASLTAPVRRRMRARIEAAVRAEMARREPTSTSVAAGPDRALVPSNVDEAALYQQVTELSAAVAEVAEQIAETRTSASVADGVARQARQQATSASATAEAAIDALDGLEQRLDGLIERLGSRA